MELINSSEGQLVVMRLDEACARIARVYSEEPARTVGDVFDLSYHLAISDPSFRGTPDVSPGDAAPSLDAEPQSTDSGSNDDTLGGDDSSHEHESSPDGPGPSFDDLDSGDEFS